MHTEMSFFTWAQDAGWRPGPRTRRAERRLRAAVAGVARRVAGAGAAGQ